MICLSLLMSVSFDSQYANTPAKYGYRYTAMICEFINATRVGKVTDTWGYFVNGSWDGQIGHIVRGEAELTGWIYHLELHFFIVAMAYLHYIVVV